MVMVMDTSEHRKWLQTIMAQHGLNELQWAEKAGLSTPNILYNYFSGRSKSISEDSRRKLGAVIGLTADDMRQGSAQNTHKNSFISPKSFQGNRDIVSSIGNQKIPVYGQAGASSPERVFLTDENIIEWDDMPDSLIGVKGAFKIIVAGDSMEPRYMAGEKADVHPYKTLAVGKDCVIVDADDGNAIIKRYMGETATEYKLAQFNPAKNFTIKKSKVKNIYYVVGRSE